MASSALLLPLAIFFFFLLPSSLDAAGFSIDLIHRDSPRSPFYNPSETLSDRMSRAIRRSNSRIDYFHSTISTTSTDISSIVLPNSGSYLMTISLGTPPVQILAIADTGSDLIWTQCSPCESCYHQDAPLFDPTKSSTYGNLSCDSSPCSALRPSSCIDSSCQYSYIYEDQSYTEGVLASETLGLSSSEFPKIAFGCGYNNNGTFDSHGSGLVGLGGGSLSLISQLSSSIDGKFAYCLVPLHQNSASSRMDFGDSAIVTGSGAISTPLISKQGSEKTFFFLDLQKISVGGKTISLPQAEKGNIIIDSGTTYSMLPTSVYEELLSLLKDAINLTTAKDPTETLDLCYELGKDFKVPDLKFDFVGAQLVLSSLNTFFPINDKVTCLAFMASDSLSIFGNVAQQNFRVGYDLQSKKVSFQPTDCTKH